MISSRKQFPNGLCCASGNVVHTLYFVQGTLFTHYIFFRKHCSENAKIYFIPVIQLKKWFSSGEKLFLSLLSETILECWKSNRIKYKSYITITYLSISTISHHLSISTISHHLHPIWCYTNHISSINSSLI